MVSGPIETTSIVWQGYIFISRTSVLAEQKQSSIVNHLIKHSNNKKNHLNNNFQSKREAATNVRVFRLRIVDVTEFHSYGLALNLMTSLPRTYHPVSFRNMPSHQRVYKYIKNENMPMVIITGEHLNFEAMAQGHGKHTRRTISVFITLLFFKQMMFLIPQSNKMPNYYYLLSWTHGNAFFLALVLVYDDKMLVISRRIQDENIPSIWVFIQQKCSLIQMPTHSNVPCSALQRSNLWYGKCQIYWILTMLFWWIVYNVKPWGCRYSFTLLLLDQFRLKREANQLSK